MVAMINEQYISRNRNFCVAGKCRSGRAALEFLDQNEVDLLVLDVYMPQMDGFETLRRIRERKIPADVIMVTAANDREALEQALHLGVLDYLVKPFTFERFTIALEKYIAQSDALRDMGTLSQKNIDFIIENTRRKGEEMHPKGIQERTLALILAHLRACTGEWRTGDAIAEAIGLTSVTVRRYCNHLARAGMVESDMDYGTGGRPCVRYRVEK